MSKQYGERDPMALDEVGGYYIRHVSAMTGENLHEKSAIAGELGYRDMVIDELKQQNEVLTRDYEAMKALYETDLEGRDKAISELLEFVKEVRRTGDTRLASMAIAVIAKVKGEV